MRFDTLHNLVRYGSVTRFDLRVGEETRIGASYVRRHGVTGRLEGGTSVSWSQGEIRLSGAGRQLAGFELTNASTFLGLVGGRTTFLGVGLTGEWTTANLAGVPDVLLFSANAVLDHESLDRIDFPRSGLDATARWEWGVTDLVDGQGFSVLTTSARLFIPLHRRVSADVGAFVGIARGPDLPTHRTFFLGGTHASAVFPLTQPLFHGLNAQELTGTAVQVGRVGIRWEVRRDAFVRVGTDVGGTMDAWSFPVEDPIVGWAVSFGVETLVGPVSLEWGKASTGSGGRLSVSVGRLF